MNRNPRDGEVKIHHIGDVKELIGIPDLADRLNRHDAQVILTTYEDSDGMWHFVRTTPGSLGVSIAEIGALAKMQMWLNEIQCDESDVEE